MTPVTDDERGLPVVRAAGGVVWRRGRAGDLEVLLVHRPRYDDWTLPKGKALLGEPDEMTAAREVDEETGLACTLGAELAATTYRDHEGRSKLVRYWAMTLTHEQAPHAPTTGGADATAFTPNDEVDELAWLPVAEARRRLTYERDRPVLDSLERLLERQPTGG